MTAQWLSWPCCHPRLAPPPAGDPASLQTAAAMGPVISIPAGTASEGLVVSGSSA